MRADQRGDVQLDRHTVGGHAHQDRRCRRAPADRTADSSAAAGPHRDEHVVGQTTPRGAAHDSATSSVDGSAAWVAPSSAAALRLAGSGSTPTMTAAPPIRAAWTPLSPTPPQPTTTAVDPARSPARCVTAPTPVTTPQPRRAADPRGIEAGTPTTWELCTIASSANPATPSPWVIGSPATVDNVGRGAEPRRRSRRIRPAGSTGTHRRSGRATR